MDEMKKAAGLLQAQGRHGDTILAHINPAEAKMLKAAGGSGTINPKTGLPEYLPGFIDKAVDFVGDNLKTAATVGAAYILGPAGASLISGSAATGAMIGAGVSGLTGGNPLKGALLGGVTGGIANFIAGGGLNDPSNWLAKLGDSFVGGTPVDEAVKGIASSETVASKAAESAGTSTNAMDFLNAGTPTPAPAAPAFRMNDVVGYDRVAANTAPVAQPGLLSKVGTWAGDNPVPALMAGQAVMAGVGGVATAQAQAEQAQADRDLRLQMSTVQGGFSNPRAITANDPNLVTDMSGRYIRGPMAGQYAPGRAPGLLNARA